MVRLNREGILTEISVWVCVFKNSYRLRYAIEFNKLGTVGK